MDEELIKTLEPIIDKYGMEVVMAHAAEICLLKAEHASVNWQDMALAREWTRRYVHINRASEHMVRKTTA